ncbi:hypothetical protein ACQPZA_22105 [Pseudonocardia xinjiangensis]|uniref:hypothetical protein n=1 Tax=Pseudonocardia xinjiangensis TaxID=75289 RepID=UPI003D919B59
MTVPDHQRWYGGALGKLATAEAAVLSCAAEHMELCVRTAAGGKPYGEEEEQRLGVIAREAIVQVWEALDQQLFRNVGSSAMNAGQRFEGLYRDMAMNASHPQHRLPRPDVPPTRPAAPRSRCHLRGSGR